MILVDTSVWIAWIKDWDTPQTAYLERERTTDRLAIGGLILLEILQGAQSEAHAQRLQQLLAGFQSVEIAGRPCAIAAAQNYRRLRAVGITPRKTIDTLIATRCLMDGLTLLHADRDFDPFETHLGLSVVKP